MFNLLVTNEAGVWERPTIGSEVDVLYSFAASRFLESTADDIKEFLRNSEEIQRLTTFPALFCYEKALGLDAQVGSVTSIQLGGGRVSFTFQVDANFAPIPMEKLGGLAIDLGFSRFELNRTHWAVKRGDLLDVLAKAGIGGVQDINESEQPDVPAARPAAIDARWIDGRLTLSEEVAQGDLALPDLESALIALRDSILELRLEADDAANVDRRFLSFLERLGARVPVDNPAPFALFRLGHDGDFLERYAATVEAQWPDLLGLRYQGLLLQLDRTLRQFPAWRAFKRNAMERDISDEEANAAVPAALEIADALTDDEGKQFVDPSIADALALLSRDAAEAAGHADDLPSFEVPTSARSLAVADLIESISNVLKPIASLALDYCRLAAGGFAAAAKEQAPKDGAVAFKWLRRIGITVTAAVFGGAFIPGGTSFLAGLVSAAPEALGWLGGVLKFILKMPG
jgi:hypothetical protein